MFRGGFYCWWFRLGILRQGLTRLILASVVAKAGLELLILCLHVVVYDVKSIMLSNVLL